MDNYNELVECKIKILRDMGGSQFIHFLADTGSESPIIKCLLVE